MSTPSRVNGHDAQRKVTRRDVLRAGAALGVLAGTAGLGGMQALAAPGADAALRRVLAQNGKPTGGEYHGWWPYTPPPVGHFNSFVADAITLGIYQGVAELPLAQYRWAGEKFLPLLATEWKLTPPDKFAITLRDGVTWSDGSAFTADDVVTTFAILQMQRAPVWNYVGAVKALDSHSVEFTMAHPSTVVPYFVLRTSIRAHSVYGDWAKKAQDLFAKYPDLSGDAPADASAKALADLTAEFNKVKLKEMVVTGPYKVDPNTITPSQLTMKKVPTSFLANTANFDTLVLYNQTDVGSIPTLILSKKMDYATSGFTPATEKAMIESGLRIVRPPTYFGPALVINYEKVKALADPKIRQALAMAIDRKTNGLVSLSNSGVPSKYMSGVPDVLIEQWLDEATLKLLNPYPLDLEKAASIFGAQGFKKDGNVWVSPQGERMEYEVMVPGENADWATAAANLADQLTRFGVKTAVRATTAPQWNGDSFPKGDFQLGISAWGSGQPHPFFSYQVDLLSKVQPVVAKGISYPLQQETSSVGKVDFNKLIVQSAEGLDKAEQVKVIATLARAFNELLPIIPLWERLGNDPILENVRVTGWPADSDPLFKNSVYADNFTIQWILDGTLKGTGKTS